MKQTALVICPGRGTYNKQELGYLGQHHANKMEFIADLDDFREKEGQLSISELDGEERYSSRIHTTGDNASLLIYACALADFADIDRDQFDIIGVTGNSMGWYLALACAGVLDPRASMFLVNTMGRLMHEEGPGGQVIYPLVNDRWQRDPALEAHVADVMRDVRAIDGVFVDYSIHLGGMAILAANDQGVACLMERLAPEQERYPLVLANHGGFHSRLMEVVSVKARELLKPDLFSQGSLPLIDGLGRIWQPGACSPEAIYNYTLNDQICQTYNYSKAIEVTVKEFAPDRLIILGPGTTLGAPTAQELIAHQWLGLASKEDFISMQEKDPFILSMGYEDQRRRVSCKEG